MQYIITAHDGPGLLDRRLAVRPRHLENMGTIRGKVLCAGGLLDGEGRMKGSVLIIDFDGPDALREYLDREPYLTVHVWEKVDCQPMNVVLLNGEKVGK